MAKVYTWNGETYNKIPNPLKLEDGTSISPVNEAAFIANGGLVEEDGEPTHMELLEAAGDKFIACCNKIGQFIGDSSFTGGIDEIQKLHDFAATLTDPAQIVQALMLVAEWEGCDKECNHWASKEDVGLASPAWWWWVWARYAEQLAGGK